MAVAIAIFKSTEFSFKPSRNQGHQMSEISEMKLREMAKNER